MRAEASVLEYGEGEGLLHDEAGKAFVAKSVGMQTIAVLVEEEGGLFVDEGSKAAQGEEVDNGY